VSELLLRTTSEGDLPALSELTEVVFGRRRSVELLRWLVLGGDTGVALESRVAVRDGRVVGHAGFLSGRYRWGARIAVGVHPILWMVAPEARGQAGMQLGGWCTDRGDFSLVIGGTPMSQPILDRRRFVRGGVAVELRLPTAGAPADGEWELAPWEETDAAIEPRGAGPGSAPPEPRPQVGAAAATSRKDPRRRPEREAARGPSSGAAPVRHLPAPSRLRWLAACPALEARLLTLRREGRSIGPVVLFVDRRPGPPRGRVVHLPDVETDLAGALRCVLAALATAGCASASYLTTAPEQRAAAESLGGEPFYERPIFYRDQAGLQAPPGWHLSYLEGDLSYRRL